MARARAREVGRIKAEDRDEDDAEEEDDVEAEMMPPMPPPPSSHPAGGLVEGSRCGARVRLY